MQNVAPVAKDIMTKQKMKIWFKRSKDSVTSPKMKFIGGEWYFTVQKDVSNTLRITIYRNFIVNRLPSNVTYDIRIIKTNDDYISIHGIISRLEYGAVCMLTGLTILHFLDAQKYLNAKHKMLIELDLSFKDEVEKLSAKNAHLFSESSPYASDCSILVGGKKIYVDKKFLSIHSAYFKAMFESGFKEKEQREIELKDLDFNEFIELLGVIYPVGESISVSNVECLLKLADRFVMPDMLKRCEKFLLSESNMDNFKKLLLAQQYSFKDLQEHCAGQYQHSEEIKKLEDKVGFGLLDERSKLIMFDSIIRASSK